MVLFPPFVDKAELPVKTYASAADVQSTFYFDSLNKLTWQCNEHFFTRQFEFAPLRLKLQK